MSLFEPVKWLNSSLHQYKKINAIFYDYFFPFLYKKNILGMDDGLSLQKEIRAFVENFYLVRQEVMT